MIQRNYECHSVCSALSAAGHTAVCAGPAVQANVLHVTCMNGCELAQLGLWCELFTPRITVNGHCFAPALPQHRRLHNTPLASTSRTV